MSWGTLRADNLLSPPTAGASPLHECGERPEDWCRDVATAAKCGALELCRLQWDRALGVTVLGAGNAGGCGRGAHLPQNMEMAGGSRPAHPSILRLAAAVCRANGKSQWVPQGVHVGCFWGGRLGSGEGLGAMTASRHVPCLSAEGDPLSPVPGGSLPGGQDPAGQPHRGGSQWDGGVGLVFLPTNPTGALNSLSVTQEKLRLFLDKRCQYLPFQDWSVKCKRMVDTGILVLVQLGKQVLVMQGEPRV